MKITPVNESAEVEGSELNYRGVILLVARANNKNFKHMLREVMKPYKLDFEKRRMEDDVAEDLMIGCVAKTVLVGWETFIDTDGRECKYSVQNAEALLRDDKDVHEAVTEFSEDIDNYIIKGVEDTKAKLSA